MHSFKVYGIWLQASKEASKEENMHNVVSQVWGRLSRARPNNWCPVASENFIVGDLIDEMSRYSSTGSMQWQWNAHLNSSLHLQVT